MAAILINLLYGLIIGTLMLIPGVSGGTTALILGIYDRVVSSVSSFRKNIKGNLLFLGLLAVGGGIGVLLLSSPLKKLINIWYAPMYCLFIGLTSGSIPMLLKKTTAKPNVKTAFKMLLWLLAGAAVVVAVEFLPGGLLTLGDPGLRRFVLLFVLGVVFSVGFVLPGISLSYLMVVFGVFEPLLAAVEGLDIMFILPLALGLAAGTVAVTKVLEKCMNQQPLPTYTMIIGFVMASDVFLLFGDVVPNINWSGSWFDIPVCLLMFAVGFCGIWAYTRLGASKEKNNKN